MSKKIDLKKLVKNIQHKPLYEGRLRKGKKRLINLAVSMEEPLKDLIKHFTIDELAIYAGVSGSTCKNYFDSSKAKKKGKYYNSLKIENGYIKRFNKEGCESNDLKECFTLFCEEHSGLKDIDKAYILKLKPSTYNRLKARLGIISPRKRKYLKINRFYPNGKEND